MKKFFLFVDGATRAIIYILLSCMIVNTAVSVFFRYVLHNAIFWSEEASRYLMVWVGFLGMGLAIRDGEHVNITFLVSALPPKMRVAVNYLAEILALGFLVIVLIFSIDQLRTVQGQTSVALMLRMYLPYASVTVGSFLMILQSLRSIASLADRGGRDRSLQ